jgi:4-hydroxy-3-polyprenylbenzoate decarboxylase
VVKDLREFLKKLEEYGELRVIDEEVDWDLEAAAICAAFNERCGEALHFKKVKDYPEFSLVGGLFAGAGLIYWRKRKPWTRIAIALGMDPNIRYEDFIKEILERRMAPVPPIEVKRAPCKKIIQEGEDVDLYKLPIPRLHQYDGGRYGVRHTVIVKDPETGFTHYGGYRWMLYDKNTAVGYFPPNSPLMRIYQKYEAMNKPMPFCIAIGGNPAIPVAQIASRPWNNWLVEPGRTEIEIAGGLCKEPIELIKAETSDLLVPADSEIVLEGVVPPRERMMEGPFPDIAWYSQPTPQPIYKVTSITRREYPIFPFVVEGIPYNDTLNLLTVMHSAEVSLLCRMFMAPFKWALILPESRMGLCIVATKFPYNGYQWQLANHLFLNSPWFDKIVFLDDDKEVEDPNIGAWALNDMIAKANPNTQWVRYDADAPPTRVAKYALQEQTTPRMFVIANFPLEWPPEWRPERISFETSWPKEIQELVVKRWKELGYTSEPYVIERRG